MNGKMVGPGLDKKGPRLGEDEARMEHLNEEIQKRPHGSLLKDILAFWFSGDFGAKTSAAGSGLPRWKNCRVEEATETCKVGL